MAAALILALMSCFTLALCVSRFTPVPFSLEDPPDLVGALLPNNGLTTLETLHEGLLTGPVSFAFLDDNIYTVTKDMKVLNVATCPPKLVVDLSPDYCGLFDTCGALTSIRVGNNGQLLVLDAYRGLYQVNPATGRIRLLFSGKTLVDGRRPKYLSDMVQTPDGTIYITDASDRYDYANDIYIIWEGRRSGRILALNASGVIDEYLKEIFGFPNGIELTSDGKHLLVTGSGRANIMKVSLDTKAYPRGTFIAENLPGGPTNIRRSPRGTYWVGMSWIRHSGMYNTLDTYSNNTSARALMHLNNLQRLRTFFPDYGLVLEIDANGTIITSFHDKTGIAYPSVSEAIEHEGLLYVGSTEPKFVGRITLIPTESLTPVTKLQLRRSRCQITEDEYQALLKKAQEATNTGSSGTNTGG
jgi:hypothetical protein